MGYNKIVYAGKTLIDLTNDTIKADTLLEGTTAHGADGEPVTGTMKKLTITDNGEGHVSFKGIAVVTNQ